MGCEILSKAPEARQGEAIRLHLDESDHDGNIGHDGHVCHTGHIC